MFGFLDNDYTTIINDPGYSLSETNDAGVEACWEKGGQD